MKILLVRHSKADYTPCMERGFIGIGLEMAELTDEGIKMAQDASLNPIFIDSQIIISSPFPRALNTAAILSKKLSLDLLTDINFREHTLDMTQQAKSFDELNEISIDFEKCNGIIPLEKNKKWEEKSSLKNRALLAINKYTKYDKIIVVTHGTLINALTGVKDVKYCGIVEYEI